MSVIPCHRKECLCAHEYPCSAGWIEFRYKTVEEKNQRDGTSITVEREYDGVRPCPTCDPERAHIFETSANRAELEDRLKSRSTLNRSTTNENYEASRTRTL